MNGIDEDVLKDLLDKAVSRSMNEVSLCTQFVPPQAVPAIWMHVSLAMLKLAAAMIAASEAAKAGQSMSDAQKWLDPKDTLNVPEVRDAFRKVLKAWALAPDGAAVDRSLQESFNATTVLRGEK